MLVRLTFFAILLCNAFGTLRANDTLMIRGHRYVFLPVANSYSDNVILYRLSDTGNVKLLELTMSISGRDEFGGGCTQTTYEVSHDTLTLWIHDVQYGEQRPRGWDYVHDYSRKMTYVFQSKGKLVLLSRVFADADADVEDEIDAHTQPCSFD